jgi:hypothetical protein
MSDSQPSPVAKSAKRAAHDAVANPWVTHFLRFGQIARGVIYVVVGMLALRLSVGIRDVAMSQNGAIAVIGRQPFGHVMLVALAVGLASYALWDLIRAVLDPNYEGQSRAGKLKRVGFALGAVGYVALAVITIQFIVGPRPSTKTSYGIVALVLSKPFGAWLVGIIGLAWAALSLVQIVRAWLGYFERNLALDRLSPAERAWARGLGRIGICARSLVFAIVGIFLVASAFHANPHHSIGIDGALLGLARQAFGRTLLAVTGIGLVAFGVYSIMCARWMRIGSGA